MQSRGTYIVDEDEVTEKLMNKMTNFALIKLKKLIMFNLDVSNR